MSDIDPIVAAEVARLDDAVYMVLLRAGSPPVPLPTSEVEIRYAREHAKPRPSRKAIAASLARLAVAGRASRVGLEWIALQGQAQREAQGLGDRLPPGLPMTDFLPPAEEKRPNTAKAPVRLSYDQEQLRRDIARLGRVYRIKVEFLDAASVHELRRLIRDLVDAREDAESRARRPWLGGFR